jgi:hypothetical protein
MAEFNNEAYAALVNDIINDAFYLKGASRRGTVAKIRQYAEVVVRRILNLSKSDTVELGNGKLLHKIEEKNNPSLLKAIKTINKMGSECTHTKSTKEITEDDVKTVLDSLFILYAYLLTEYFEKYEFGTNSEIVHKFSILPPIIRYLTLDYLYSKYPENIMIIDKLSLVILKALNKEAAIKWIEERKEKLKITPSFTKNAEKDIIENNGEELARIIISTAPNMYDLCTERINLVTDNISKNGKLYNNFESAIDYYKTSGTVSGESSDIKEFNSIMEFLYLGRKSKKELN